MAKLHLAKEILDIIYPIGSVYISVNATNPSTLFGGGWTRITGRFLLGADDSTYKNGVTGGEATHKLTVSEMPKHNHPVTLSGSETSSHAYFNWVYVPPEESNKTRSYDGYDLAQITGGNAAHNNMPPYLVVYMWKRTS